MAEQVSSIGDLIGEFADDLPDRALTVVEALLAENGVTWPAILTSWTRWCDEMAAQYGWCTRDWDTEGGRHLEEMMGVARAIDADTRAQLASAHAGEESDVSGR